MSPRRRLVLSLLGSCAVVAGLALLAAPGDRELLGWWLGVWSAGVLLPAAGLRSGCARRWRDARRPPPGRVYEPPAGQPLVYGYAMADEQLADSSRALTATLLDLMARGYYRSEPVRDPDSGDWRLLLAVAAGRPAAPRATGERAVLEWTDALLVSGPCRLDQLGARVRERVHARAELEAVWTALQADGRRALDQQQDRAPYVHGAVYLWALSVVLATGAASADRPPGWAALLGGALLGWCLHGALGALPRGQLVYTPARTADQQGYWRSWRDWITQLSSMEQAPELQAVLWQRAFAGAVLWGVAAEFARRVQQLAPAGLDEAAWGELALEVGGELLLGLAVEGVMELGATLLAEGLGELLSL